MKTTTRSILPAFTVKFSGKLLLALLLGGLTSANASLFQYQVILDGPSESPPNASPGTGFATVDYDDAAHTLAINMSWSGLTGTTTASHIHAATTLPGTGTAGVATTTPYFTGFPIGVTSGSFSTVLNLTQSNAYNPSYIGANGGTPSSAEVALVGAIAADKAYLNIHSQTFPGGEIRGFLIPIPEPSSLALASLGGLALAGRICRRRNS